MSKRRSEEPATGSKKRSSNGDTTLHVIVGSYDRVLHGIAACISGKAVSFNDTFLFNAHTSSIRCLALSPPIQNGGKRLLASGGTDERIHVYQLGPLNAEKDVKGGIASNRQLGSLLHHSAPISRLSFVSRSKLLSAADDSAITITRTRDWTQIESVAVPVPKTSSVAGGKHPTGINDFAVHSSRKLMISLSLWLVGQSSRIAMLLRKP